MATNTKEKPVQFKIFDESDVVSVLEKLKQVAAMSPSDFSQLRRDYIPNLFQAGFIEYLSVDNALLFSEITISTGGCVQFFWHHFPEEVQRELSTVLLNAFDEELRKAEEEKIKSGNLSLYERVFRKYVGSFLLMRKFNFYYFSNTVFRSLKFLPKNKTEANSLLRFIEDLSLFVDYTDSGLDLSVFYCRVKEILQNYFNNKDFRKK